MFLSPTEASGGLREAMSCDVCSDVYEQVQRTPLVLPCGHTFCRACLTDIRKSGRFQCPTCRAGHNNLQVEALTVNYSLLNILPLCNQFEVSVGREGEEECQGGRSGECLSKTLVSDAMFGK